MLVIDPSVLSEAVGPSATAPPVTSGGALTGIAPAAINQNITRYPNTLDEEDSVVVTPMGKLNPQSGPGSFVAAMGGARETLPKTSGVLPGASLTLTGQAGPAGGSAVKPVRGLGRICRLSPDPNSAGSGAKSKSPSTRGISQSKISATQPEYILIPTNWRAQSVVSRWRWTPAGAICSDIKPLKRKKPDLPTALPV